MSADMSSGDTTSPQGSEAAEPLPPVSKDDAIERTGRVEEVVGESRSFDGEAGAEPAASVNEGRLGPGADPAEGKR